MQLNTNDFKDKEIETLKEETLKIENLINQIKNSIFSFSRCAESIKNYSNSMNTLVSAFYSGDKKYSKVGKEIEDSFLSLIQTSEFSVIII